MPRPTVRDVALHAGTSTAVVSYVLNDGPRPVAAATRERVLAAMAELGYRRDQVARSMRAGRTSALGIVLPDLRKSFFAELAAAVESSARAGDQTVLVSASHFDDDRERAAIERLLESRVDGIVLVPGTTGLTSAELLRRSRTPFVVVHRHVEGVPSVVGADHEAGVVAAEHLLDHGHRVIGCLSGPGAGSPVVHRTRGFSDGLRRHGTDLRSEQIRSCGYHDLHQNAYRATHDLLTEFPKITALCATTDEHALGAMRAAVDLGRRIGEELALISIDGTQQAQFLTPALTTLSVPFAEVADSALRLLRADDGSESARISEAVSLALERRRSCGCR